MTIKPPAEETDGKGEEAGGSGGGGDGGSSSSSSKGVGEGEGAREGGAVASGGGKEGKVSEWLVVGCDNSRIIV